MATVYRQNYTEGQKIGELILLNRVEPKEIGDSPLGNFKCTCGTEFISRIYSVKIGKTKSCGCLRPKVIIQPKNIYEVGQKLGTCVYLGDAPYKKNWSRKAHFMCQCGNKFITPICSIISGETKSCGCLTGKFHSEKGGLPEKEMPMMSVEDIERFWQKVWITANDKQCWDWQAKGNNGRYGAFSVKGSMYKASRVAYFLSFKQDPKELSVMHSCDNPKCCNPKHLSLGTHLDNMRDMAKKGRSFKGDRARNFI